MLSIQVLMAQCQIEFLYYSKPIIDEGVKKGDFDVVVSIAFYMILLTAVIVAMSFVVSRASAWMSARVGSEIRRDLFESVMDMRAPDECTRDPSDTMVRMTTDVNNVQEYTYYLLSVMLYIPPTLVLLIYYVGSVSQVAAATMLVSYLAVIAFMVASGKRLRWMVDDLQQRMDHVNSIFRDTASGARAIRAFGKREYEIGHFDDVHSGFVTSNSRFNNNSFFYPLLGVAAVNFVLVMVYNVGGSLAGDFEMTVADLSFIVQLWGCLIGCMVAVPFLTTMSPRYQVGKRRVLEVLDHVPDASPKERTDPMADIPIVFDDASFAAPNGAPIVSGVDFSVGRGEIVVLTGLTGPAKRSIVHAMLAAEPPASGSVSVLGTDISVADPEDLRRRVTVVSDRVMMLRTTIRENITMGEDIDDGELARICSDACLTSVVESRGLDTDLGSCGEELSNGQRQRIAIARGIARDASVRIFDDCFYSLDPITEAEVVENIIRRGAGETLIFLTGSQRVASMADRVVFFDGDRFVSAGTHDQLLESEPGYAAMRGLQGASG